MYSISKSGLSFERNFKELLSTKYFFSKQLVLLKMSFLGDYFLLINISSKIPLSKI